MKWSITVYLIMLILSISFISCSCTHNNVNPLSQADSLMQSRPDSALNILRSVMQPESMNEENRAMYALLLTQAMDKNHLPHTNDSLIRIAVKFYQQEADKDKKAQSFFYLGRVYQETNDTLGAIEAYLDALEANPESQKLRTMIYDNLATCYKNQRLYEKAKKAYQKAFQISTDSKAEQQALYAIRGMGSIYAIEDSMSMALNHYLKALSILNSVNDSTWKSAILCDIARTYEAMEMHKEAESYINQSIRYTPANDNLSATYFWKGEILHSLHQYDSATHYLKAAYPNSDLYTQVSIYQALYNLNVERGNYKQAVLYNDTALLLNDSVQILMYYSETESLVREHSIELYKQELKSKHQRKISIVVICALSGFILILISAIYLNSRNKETNIKLQLQLMKNQAEKVFLKKRVKQLTQILEDTDTEKQEIQSSLIHLWEQTSLVCAQLFRTTDSNQRITTLEITKAKRNKEQTHEEIEFIRNDINESFSEAFQQLNEMHPGLTSDDLFYCALNFLKAPIEVIKICMRIESTQALTQRKHRIKNKSMLRCFVLYSVQRLYKNKK